MAILRNRAVLSVLVLAALATSFYGGWAARSALPATVPANERMQVQREGYDNLVNPLLSCDIPDQKEFTEFAPIEKVIQALVDRKVSTNQATSISVYFRTMNSGRWVGVNENEKYTPASLLKVPIMIAYYKEAEASPDILTKKVTYAITPAMRSLINLDAPDLLTENKEYTIEELIEQMITKSDNVALYLLANSIDPNSLKEVYSDLGVPFGTGQDPTEPDQMSAKNYSTFFRVLYNATYLDKEMSQRALHVLTQATFADGIVKGLGAPLIVAHKFGKHTVTGSTGAVTDRELHDCGIVYYPDHPYFLCVMTKGVDYDQMATTISDVSGLVYQEVVKLFPQQQKQ